MCRCNLYLFHLQDLLRLLTDQKSDLFNINLGVHNLIATYKTLDQGRLNMDAHEEHMGVIQELKGAVVALYAQWDDTYHR